MPVARKPPTSADYARGVQTLLDSAEGLEPGPTKVAILEEAVRLADAHQDAELGYAARQGLIDAATFGGAPEVAMVAYAWCLARYDADPDKFDDHLLMLLWKYKWVIDVTPDYPTIDREQIERMLADMERRYAAVGVGDHPVQQMAREIYRLMGHLDAAKAAHQRVRKARRELLSNCPACEEHAKVKFYLDTGRVAHALKTAEPLVSGGKGCAEVPHTTYSYLLLPVLFRGDPDTAADYHRRGLRLLGTNPKFISEVARHIIFLIVTDNLTAATRLFEKRLADGLANTCPARRFDFDRAAVFLLDRLADQRRPPRLRPPAGVTLPGGLDGTDPVALRDEFARNARQTAEAFDRRNGNDRFARLLGELDGLKKRVTPFKV